MYNLLHYLELANLADKYDAKTSHDIKVLNEALYTTAAAVHNTTFTPVSFNEINSIDDLKQVILNSVQTKHSGNVIAVVKLGYIHAFSHAKHRTNVQQSTKSVPGNEYQQQSTRNTPNQNTQQSNEKSGNTQTYVKNSVHVRRDLIPYVDFPNIQDKDYGEPFYRGIGFDVSVSILSINEQTITNTTEVQFHSNYHYGEIVLNHQNGKYYFAKYGIVKNGIKPMITLSSSYQNTMTFEEFITQTEYRLPLPKDTIAVELYESTPISNATTIGELADIKNYNQFIVTYDSKSATSNIRIDVAAKKIIAHYSSNGSTLVMVIDNKIASIGGHYYTVIPIGSTNVQVDTNIRGYTLL